jgi:hypothetical protein
VIDVPAGDRDTHVPVPKLFKVLGIAHSFSVDEKTLEFRDEGTAENAASR